MKYGNQKKLSVVCSYIARDFFTREIPSRIPTITEYCAMFDVSRGVVQDALAELERSECVQLNKRGSKGSFLVGRKERVLYNYTLWDVVTGTMPAPLDISLQGLATGLCNTMNECDVPFTFAFITGARRRAQTLNHGVYDFSVMSALSARHYIEKWPNLQVIASLHPAYYTSFPYVLIINRPDATGIEDGMRAMYDSNCFDQTKLTNSICKGKKVEMIEDAYVGQREKFYLGAMDAFVFRGDDWVEGLENATVLPLPDQDGSTEPVILANRENYCIDKLLASVFNAKEIAAVQREVCEDPAKVRFF